MCQNMLQQQKKDNANSANIDTFNYNQYDENYRRNNRGKENRLDAGYQWQNLKERRASISTLLCKKYFINI